jgi:DNA end-binding protein Ku
MRKPRAKSSKAAPKATAASGQGRSLWTGQLRLALVSVPVQLVSAVKTGARIAFHQVDQKSGKRIRYEKVAPGIGKVEADNIVRGFEISKGKYVFVSDDDIENVKIEAKRTIDLIQFVDHCEIDPIYFDKPYYVLPDGDLAEEAYGVLRDALRSTGKMGLGQFVMRGHEYVVALKPCGAGMMLETLRFADEVREAAPFFADVTDDKPAKELLDLAKELIGRKTQKFEPGRFHDHYTEALRALIEAKAKHQPIEVDDDSDSGNRSNVIDLVEALRRSVRDNEASNVTATPKAAARPKAAAKNAAPAKRVRAR